MVFITKALRSGSVVEKKKAAALHKIEHLCDLASEEHFVAPRGISRKQSRKGQPKFQIALNI